MPLQQLIIIAGRSRGAQIRAFFITRLRERHRRRHMGEMRERLRVVAEQLAAVGVGLLREQPQRARGYELEPDPPAPCSDTEQNPPRRRSSSRPKQLPLSNRGRQHQSIDPSRETSAALWQSPINP
jgi:hypothetical protein